MTPEKKNLPDKTTATPDTVAEWMLEELEKQHSVLYQAEAAPQIADLFGEYFIYKNDSATPVSISKCLPPSANLPVMEWCGAVASGSGVGAG
jgi:hypothetical protein